MSKSNFGLVYIKPNGKQHSFIEFDTKEKAIKAFVDLGPEIKRVVKGDFEATPGEFWIVYRMPASSFWRALLFSQYRNAKKVLDAMVGEAYYEAHMYKTLDT